MNPGIEENLNPIIFMIHHCINFDISKSVRSSIFRYYLISFLITSFLLHKTLVGDPC